MDYVRIVILENGEGMLERYIEKNVGNIENFLMLKRELRNMSNDQKQKSCEGRFLNGGENCIQSDVWKFKLTGARGIPKKLRHIIAALMSENVIESDGS